MCVEDILLLYVTGDTHDSFPLWQGREPPFDPDSGGGDARGGVRVRSKWKAAACP